MKIHKEGPCCAGGAALFQMGGALSTAGADAEALPQGLISAAAKVSISFPDTRPDCQLFLYHSFRNSLFNYGEGNESTLCVSGQMLGREKR